MKTVNGKPVSEQQIDAWVNEAEKGYPTELLRKRGRPTRANTPSKVVPLRLSAEELQALDAYAEHNNMNRSQALRKALHKLVSL